MPLRPSSSSSQESSSSTTLLVRPSSTNPWDVQVVNVAPKNVESEVLSKIDSAGGAVVGAVTNNDGYVAVFYKNNIHIWSRSPTTSSSSSSTGFALLKPPSQVYACFHPNMSSSSSRHDDDDGDPPLLLALSSSSSSSMNSTPGGKRALTSPTTSRNNTFVHVLTANPISGMILFWKVPVGGTATFLPRKADAKIVVPLAVGVDDDDEKVSFLECLSRYGFILGTTHGRLFSCSITTRPCMLNASELSRKSSSSSWMLGRLFFGSSDSTSRVQRQNHDSICAVHATNNNSFVSVTASGVVELWSTNSSSSDDFQHAAILATLAQVLEEEQHANTNRGGSVQVLKSAVDVTGESTSTLHCIVRYNDSRIFWIQASVDQSTQPSFKSTSIAWLNRFHPEVECVGVITTQTHHCYAMFQYPNGVGPVTCVCMTTNNIMQEVDFPQTHVPQFVKGTLGRDMITHGCWGLASTGLGIRSRCHVEQEDDSAGDVDVNRNLVLTLTRHLTSSFLHWYQHPHTEQTVRLPPSLQTAEAAPLERAVLESAKQLQVASHVNHLECHLSFINMLQQGGIYRSLSRKARWILLGIGQQLSTYRALIDQRSGLSFRTNDVAKVLWEHHTPNDAASYQLLTTALQTADTFRTEYAQTKYDIVDCSNPPSGLRVLLPTDKHLQQLMRKVLWDEADALLKDQIKLFAKLALQSHRETSGESQSSEAVYRDVKQVAIPLVRRIPDDTLAFELSVDHAWYEGLCQMSLDHRKEAGYGLEPLFATFDSSFAHFVLDWFTAKERFADVLNYGRLAPEILKSKCETDGRLVRCRWIAAVRSGEYDQAGDWLIHAAAINGDEAMSLEDTKRALSLAKLTLPRKRRKVASAQLELVRAQEMLLEGSDPPDQVQPLQTPQELLSIALAKLETSQDKEDSIQFAVIGLAIAKTIEDAEDRVRAAARIWSKCINLELPQWKEWIRGENDFTEADLNKHILESTLFGGLWMEVCENRDEVSYKSSAPIEYEVLELLGLNPMENVEFKRLFGSVTSFAGGNNQ